VLTAIFTITFVLLTMFFLSVAGWAVWDWGRCPNALACVIALIYGTAATVTFITLIEYLSQ
jgi:hypothetical protein